MGYSISHHGSEYGETHHTVRASLYGVTPENRLAAIERLQAGRQPAAPGHIDNWIAAMHAATKHRSEDTAGLGLIRSLYRSILSKYPGSVARETCLHLTTRCEWFPTAKELTDACDAAKMRYDAVLKELTGKPREPVMLSGREAELEGLREEQAGLRKRLGFVGDVSALSPERRVMFDRDREMTKRIGELSRRQAVEAAA